jgi:aquaporin Z
MELETRLRKRVAAELIGTFALVFAGTAAVVVNEASGAVTHVGVALTFGLVVFAMISAVGDVSGAHLNPAVTLGFWTAGRIRGRDVAPYVTGQCAGAIAASLAVRALFPLSERLGATSPAGPAAQSFVLEVLLTAALMFVILNVSSGAKERGLTAGLAIGGVVALEALFAGPVSGASMNPARSLAPALVAWRPGGLWIYLLAPPLGAAMAVFGCRCVRDGCCPPGPGRGAAGGSGARCA